jgi:hypothetical protein
MLCSWELIKEVQITCAANTSLAVVAVRYGKNIKLVIITKVRSYPTQIMLLNLANTNLHLIHHLPQFLQEFCLIVLLSLTMFSIDDSYPTTSGLTSLNIIHVGSMQ